MNAVAAKPELPFNPAVFRWARERMALTPEETARRLKVDLDKLEAWESGDRQPTVNQARRLAKLYERPFLEFFSRELPSISPVSLVPDYRLHRTSPSPTDEVARAAFQSWAETQRLNALDLLEMLREDVPNLPEKLFSSVDESPERAAERVREAIGFTLEEQVDIPKADRRLVPDRIRARMSAAGILVLRRGDIQKLGIRGMCLFSIPMPIVVYGGEAPGAQAFTLSHELGHIAIKSSAVSGPAATGRNVRKEEDWCNRFAAAFLVPRAILANIFPKPDFVLKTFPDEKLRSLAEKFAISPHAMLIRLITLKYVESKFYWSDKRQQFMQEEEEYKSPPMRAPYYGSRYKNNLGNFYTGLVLEAWGSGAISGHNAAEFLGIKNIRHLSDIRERFPK